MMWKQGHARDAQAGVTLIEMMVVLAVVGVAAGATTLGLASVGSDNSAELAARRLASEMSGAADAALIAGKPHRLVWDATGYTLAAGRVDLREDIVLARSDGLANDVIIAPGTEAGDVVLVLSGASETWQVRFDGLSAAVLP